MLVDRETTRGTQAPAKVGLGNTTNYVSKTRRTDVRRRRYKLQAVAQDLLQDTLPGRVSVCMKKMKGETVAVMHSTEHGHAYYDGVFVCGSVWTCPVCAAKVTEERRQELNQAVSGTKYTKILVTVTLQHSREDEPSELLDALNDSARKLKQGRYWQDTRERFGLVAYVSSLEFTYGLSAGWHPHKHMLLFSSLPEDEINVAELKAHLVSRWQKILQKRKVKRYASEMYGIDVRIGDEHVSEYTAKWGLVEEVTKAHVKNGRSGGYSPFQLLELYAEGKEWAGGLFQEYAYATYRKRQLTWSRGARDILGLNEERSDEEIAEETPGETDIVVIRLTKTQWGAVVRQNLRSRLLDVADSGNPLEVVGFLERQGIPVEMSIKQFM